MNARFFIFLLAAWYPAVLLVTFTIGSAYAEQFRNAGALVQAFTYYIFVIIWFAPLLYKAFAPSERAK